MNYPLPFNEQARLNALRELRIFRSERTPEFNAIVELAAGVFDCPVALISLVGEDEQWFKAKCGLAADGTSRGVAFCAHALMGKDILVVEDARKDPRFLDNPLVTGEPHIRFYAGCPISVDGEHVLGTLCVIDSEPRMTTAYERSQLKRLATAVEGLIRAHDSSRRTRELAEAAEIRDAQIRRQWKLLEQVTRVSGVGGWELEFPDNKLTWTDQTKRLHEVPADYEPQLDTAIEFYAPEARPIIQTAVEKGTESGRGWDVELPFITATGRHTWVRAVGAPVYDGGQLTGLVGAFQDISERKESELRLRESERLARLHYEELDVTLSNMTQGVSVFDSNARLTVWNRQYIDIFEKPDGEIEKGVSFHRVIESEKERGDFEGDVDEMVSGLIQKMRDGETQVSQLRLRSGRIVSSVHAPMPGGGWVGTHADITAQVEAAERIQHAALHDTLTGLANRSLFNLEIERTIENVRSGRQQMALMLLDLDRFKQVNDLLGHPVGDALLVQVAERLRFCVRPSDLVARLGGDEFAVIFRDRNISKDNLAKIAGRIVRDISRPFKINGHTTEIGASIGITIASPTDCDAETLLAQADSALYKVKQNGRSDYRFFDTAIAEEMARRRERAAAMRAAIEQKALDLVYRPIMKLRDRSFSGAEVSVRWRDSTYSDLTPAEIVRAAEEIGATTELGGMIIERAISDACAWEWDKALCINVSMRQLGQGDLLKQVRSALERYRFEGRRLELAICGQVLTRDDAASFDELHALRKLGVRIILRGFGTGDAAFNNLCRFPFDGVKIDACLAQRLDEDPQSSSIMCAIAGLAKDLGIEATADGIEGEMQMAMLTAAGCVHGQGEHIGTSVTADELFSGGRTLVANSA
ncbi:sensor domain-containing phosphodiesterase [Oricola cellulosilytica]|uniref:sensor domain-containing phosphodiesterase n=1 Tax=Oricola cellulosilytica TaxID=1429082 RepID=UPI00130500D0|nr:EAL domain-containing protein [Oricola cellulosilytica]